MMFVRCYHTDAKLRKSYGKETKRASKRAIISFFLLVFLCICLTSHTFFSALVLVSFCRGRNSYYGREEYSLIRLNKKGEDENQSHLPLLGVIFTR